MTNIQPFSRTRFLLPALLLLAALLLLLPAGAQADAGDVLITDDWTKTQIEAFFAGDASSGGKVFDTTYADCTRIVFDGNFSNHGFSVNHSRNTVIIRLENRTNINGNSLTHGNSSFFSYSAGNEVVFGQLNAPIRITIDEDATATVAAGTTSNLGSASVIIEGGGTLALDGAITSGSLSIYDDSSLLINAPATFGFIYLVDESSVVMNSNVEVITTIYSNEGNSVTIASGKTLTLGSSQTAESSINASVINNGELVKDGTGKLTLTNMTGDGVLRTQGGELVLDMDYTTNFLSITNNAKLTVPVGRTLTHKIMNGVNSFSCDGTIEVAGTLVLAGITGGGATVFDMLPGSTLVYVDADTLSLTAPGKTVNLTPSASSQVLFQCVYRNLHADHRSKYVQNAVYYQGTVVNIVDAATGDPIPGATLSGLPAGDWVKQVVTLWITDAYVDFTVYALNTDSVVSASAPGYEDSGSVALSTIASQYGVVFDDSQPNFPTLTIELTKKDSGTASVPYIPTPSVPNDYPVSDAQLRYDPQAGGELALSVDAPLSALTGVRLGGIALEQGEDYTAVTKDGKTVITLTDEALAGYAQGTYALVADFSTGRSAYAEVTILDNEVPTGEPSQPDPVAPAQASGGSAQVRLSATLYSRPTSKSTRILSLSHGTELALLGFDGLYAKVEYLETIGYVKGDSLNSQLASPIEGQLTRRLYLYRYPDLKENFGPWLLKGDTVILTERIGPWWKVDWHGETFYVQAKYIQVR